MTKDKEVENINAYLSKPDNKNQADKLANQVLNTTISALTTYGNVLTEAHKEALSILAKALAYSLYAKSGKRTLIPLFTGGGKTQTVISHAAAVVTNEIERGVWISVGTIEEIEEIAEALMERGIPRKLIGCKYYKSVTNVTSKNAENFPIIISTHERIRSCDYEYLTMFKGERRQLIWDEALISTRTHFMKFEKLFGEIYQWKSMYDLNKLRRQNTRPHDDTEQYFNALLGSISLAKDKTVIKLPEHPGKLELDLFTGPTLEALELPIANEAYIDKDSHMFNWCITVPDEFSNIVILDASGSHRLLEQYDSSILIYPMRVYKDYSDVTINYCKAFVGKHSLNDPSKNLPMYQELAHIVRSLDKDKKVVCFHLPEKIGVEHPPQRMNLTLNNDIDKGRVIYRSWGASKGVNSLSEVMYGIHIGMIYRDPTELSTAITAQKRDTLNSLKDKERYEVQVSEHADQIYQALNRLQCRHTVEGRALPAEFWLFYPDDKVLDILKELMPHIKIKDYDPVYLRKRESAYSNAMKIRSWIVETDPDVASIHLLKKRLDINVEKDSTVWKDTRKILIQTLPGIGHCLEPSARSIRRINRPELGGKGRH